MIEDSRKVIDWSWRVFSRSGGEVHNVRNIGMVICIQEVGKRKRSIQPRRQQLLYVSEGFERLWLFVAQFNA